MLCNTTSSQPLQAPALHKPGDKVQRLGLLTYAASQLDNYCGSLWQQERAQDLQGCFYNLMLVLRCDGPLCQMLVCKDTSLRLPDSTDVHSLTAKVEPCWPWGCANLALQEDYVLYRCVPHLLGVIQERWVVERPFGIVFYDRCIHPCEASISGRGQLQRGALVGRVIVRHDKGVVGDCDDIHLQATLLLRMLSIHHGPVAAPMLPFKLAASAEEGNTP